MSITDELREFIESHLYLGATALGGWKEAAFAIADRIDEAHESSYKDGYDEGAADILAFCDRLQEAAQGHEDVTLWGVDYVALPVDADGEPWHIGDEIVNEHNAHATVSEITYKGNGRWMLHAEPNLNFYAELARHYYPPTVEDVLREFANECLTYATCVDDHEVADAIELYAKRLRLAGDDE